MNYLEQPVLYGMLMCVAGFGIPVMAAWGQSLIAQR